MTVKYFTSNRSAKKTLHAYYIIVEEVVSLHLSALFKCNQFSDFYFLGGGWGGGGGGGVLSMCDFWGSC